MRTIFSRNQHFSGPVLGHTGLNKAGLHLFRLHLASLCFSWRRLLHSRRAHYGALRQLKRDGYLVLNDFLPTAQFSGLQQEIRQKIATADSLAPVQFFNEQGFGKKHFFSGGFDRYDGTTLNRFYDIQPQDQALSHLSRTPCLLSLLGCLAGVPARSGQFSLYKVIHGAEHNNPDIQKDWHRDTFGPALKMWYFTEDVTPEHGPFEYIPGSHRMTKARQVWEYRQSVAAAQQKAGGSFRIDEQEVCQMYNSKPRQVCVAANTLVLADIRGFHRRGNAQPGVERVSVYANFRPHPFKFW